MTTDTTHMPPNIARLPRDKHGRPIPWFVHIDEHGIPDFRIIRAGGIEDAHRFGAFVLGPMCAVNRTSAEPSCHRDCAIYSALACPFLTTPNMVRRERGLEHKNVAGIMITRNPGVTLVWITREWRPFRAPDGVLFEIGEPTETLWYAQGRDATRAEIQHSIDTGLPILQEAAQLEGHGAQDELDRRLANVQALLPAAAGCG